MSEDCLGARFEILLDGKTQHCRVTMNTAMGAANIIQRQNSNAGEKFRMLVTLICSPLTTMAPRAGYLNRSCDRAKSVRVRPAPPSDLRGAGDRGGASQRAGAASAGGVSPALAHQHSNFPPAGSSDRRASRRCRRPAERPFKPGHCAFGSATVEASMDLAVASEPGLN